MELFGAAQKWPDMSIEDTVRTVRDSKATLTSLDYVAIQSVNLAIAACSSNGKWPPMSPARFTETVLKRFREHFPKFSDAVQMEEAT